MAKVSYTASLFLSSLPSDPYLDDGMKGFIYNTARKNYKRIAGYELIDLIQEGCVCFYKCRARYVGKPGWKGGVHHEGFVDVAMKDRTNKKYQFRHLPKKNPDRLAQRHLSDLVKRAFANRIFDLVKRQPAIEVPVSQMVREDQTVNDVWNYILPTEDELGSINVLLANAPKEITQLFNLLITDAVDGFRRFGQGRRAPRETNNRRFCRLLGLSADNDIESLITNYFCK